MTTVRKLCGGLPLVQTSRFAGLLVALFIASTSYSFAQALRDPTLPPVNLRSTLAEAEAAGVDASAKPIVLSGIKYDFRKPIATINGQNVALGETVDQLKVIKIEPTQVIVKHVNGKELTLTLNPLIEIKKH